MRVAPSPPAREVRGAGGRQIGWQERRPPAGVSSASTGGAQLSARSVGRQTMLGSRSIGVVILLGLLGPFCPLSALGKPFSLVAPKRMTICTSAWPGKGSLGGACAPSWILVDEPVAIEDLRRIEITHSSSHPNVKLRSEFLLPRDTLREELAGALGNGDLVALAAFSGSTPYRFDDWSWIWSWRWPEGHNAIERLSTLVRLGSHDARFETEVLFDSSCTGDAKTTAAQLVVATSAGPPATPMVVELRQDPPERELQANRKELLALGADQSQPVKLVVWGQPMQVVADILKSLFKVKVHLAPEVERRMVIFAADPAPYVDAFVLFAYRESLRFEVRGDTLFVLDATQP